MSNNPRQVINALRCELALSDKCEQCDYYRDDSCCADLEIYNDASNMIESLSAKNDRLYYTLQGVMHFVDKWLDCEPYYDIEDTDGSIAVQSAADAREIALKSIENLRDLAEHRLKRKNMYKQRSEEDRIEKIKLRNQVKELEEKLDAAKVGD